jgi:hypothetical protein
MTIKEMFIELKKNFPACQCMDKATGRYYQYPNDLPDDVGKKPEYHAMFIDQG